MFDANHPALRFGAPTTDTLRFFTTFVACVDSSKRTPKWVLEYVSKETMYGDGNRWGAALSRGTSWRKRPPAAGCAPLRQRGRHPHN